MVRGREMEHLPFLNSDEIDDFQTDKRPRSDIKNENAGHDRYTPLHVKSEVMYEYILPLENAMMSDI